MLRPDDVIGETAWTREGKWRTPSTTEQPNKRQQITLACSAPRFLNATPPGWHVVHPARSGYSMTFPD